MKMRWRRVCFSWFALMLSLSIFGSFAPQANAALSGDNFVTEITFPSGWAVLSVAVDSQGNIFVGANDTVWRSTDNGNTWAKVLDIGSRADLSPYLLYVDSNDIIHTNLWNTSNYYSQYRSIDSGDT